MDLSTSLMGIGFLALFMAPILMVINNQYKKNRNLKKQLSEVAKEKQLEFLVTEITHRIVIGLDQQKKELVFAPITSDKLTFEHINLKDLTGEELLISETKQDGITEIRLHISENNTNHDLIFYNDSTDIGVDALASKLTAKKWEKLVVLN